MAINLDAIRNRLNGLKNANNRTSNIWKPEPGEHQIRIVPYTHNRENPFIELYFYYNLAKRSIVSPSSFGRPDPIIEAANKLKQVGDKESWLQGRQLEPKMRTYVPVLVRGQENEGVKFWGFGKQVYQELLSIISDPDFGDITDLTSGRDIVVEFKTGDESGKSFPETNIRVKPNVSLAVDPKNAQLLEALKSQVNILDLFPEFSYDELKDVMDKWLNPDTTESVETSTVVAEDDTELSETVSAPAAAKPAAVKPSVSPSATKAKAATSDDVTQAFDDLFNS